MILWNENCFVAATVKDMKEHARTYELRYREHANTAWYFYIMVLDIIRDRVSMYMLSCAHGDPMKLAIKLLNMTNLKDNIERKELTYRKPEWLKTMEQKKGNQAQHGGMRTPKRGNFHGPNQGGGHSENGQDQFGQHGRNKRVRGEVQHNNSQDFSLMLTAEERYLQLFHPMKS